VEQHNQHVQDPKEDKKNSPNHLSVQHIGVPCRIYHKIIVTMYLHKCRIYEQEKVKFIFYIA